MSFRNLLQGETIASQGKLNHFFNSIHEERILWYPSAGNDYRDLIEMATHRRKLHRIEDEPTIYCHTDYYYHKISEDNPILFDDGRTSITIIDKVPLVFTPACEVDYFVSPKCTVFSEQANSKPLIYLLNLFVESSSLGQFTATVFYFLFENHNFLQQVILKQNLSISHFVKVREGCGFGGNRKSITIFYSLLSNLGVKYILADDFVHYDRKMHDYIASEFSINHRDFYLEFLNQITSWSGLKVNVFKVIDKHGYLTEDEFHEILQIIAGSCRNQTIYTET